VYDFLLVGGNLPAGLTLNGTTGVISGTPMTTGTHYFTIQAIGNNGCTGARAFKLVVTSQAAVCSQSFDFVSVPNLPANWGSTAAGSLRPWVTSSVHTATTSGNAAFAASDPAAGRTEMYTPFFAVGSTGSQITFGNAFNLEDSVDDLNLGYDGMVLEISVLGGPYQDIVAAGGGFVTGGYNKVVSTQFGSSLSGRMAWSGLSGGTVAAPQFITTTVNLPPAANGKTVRLRWVVATDDKVAASGLSGAWIDSIVGGACSVTAAEVEVSGRVITADGRGLRNAVVRISDSTGSIRTVTTSSFGYYRFENVEVGQAYVISVGSRRYRFAPRLVNITDTATDLNLVALE
jgi:Carboxypeptidase regulatory-like domain/Putative Ig domain